MSRALRRLPEVIAAVSAVGAARYVAGAAFTRGFPLDDAWIHMVYGLALRTEGALAYNDGAPATGTTSPPWALVAALAHLVTGARGPSMSAALALKVLGILLHATTAVLAARLASACVRRELRAVAAIAAGVLVGIAPIGAMSAVSGMEVPLASALLLGAFLAIARGRPRIAGAAIGVAIATRPEAITVLPFVVFAAAFSSRERLRAALEVLGTASVVPAALALRNLRLSGRPLPATFYQKAHPLHLDRLDVELRIVFDYMLERLPPYGSAVLAALSLLAIGLALLAVKQRAAHALSGAVVSGSAAGGALAWLGAMAVTASGVSPGTFYAQRYFAPPLPLLSCAAVLVAAHVATYWVRVSSPWVRRGIVALPAMLLFVPAASHLPEDRARYEGDVAAIDAVQVALGGIVARETAPGAVVWSQDAGAPRYFGRRRVVDLCRLNTPELLRVPDLPMSLAPALVLVSPTVFDVTSDGPLDLVTSVVPKDSNDRHARQVALRCTAAANTVTVDFRGVRIASAPCPK